MKSFIGLILVALVSLIGGVHANAFIDFGTHIHTGEHISRDNITQIVVETTDAIVTQMASISGVEKAEVNRRLVKFLFFVTDDATLAGAKFLLNLTEEIHMNSLPVNATHYVNGKKVAVIRSVFMGLHILFNSLALKICGTSYLYVARFGWPLLFNLAVPSLYGFAEWVVYQFAEAISTTRVGGWFHGFLILIGCDKAGDALYLFVTYGCFSFTHLSMLIGLFAGYFRAVAEKEKKDTDDRMKANEVNTQVAVQTTKSIAQTTNVMAANMDVMQQGMMSLQSMFTKLVTPVITPDKPVQHIPSVPTPVAGAAGSLVVANPVAETGEGETQEETDDSRSDFENFSIQYHRNLMASRKSAPAASAPPAALY